MKKEMRLVIESGARVLALAGVFIAFWILVGPSFVSAGNIENIFRQSAVFAMGGLGMTMIMLTGGIDLAAGSTIALSMVVTAMTLRMGGPRASGGVYASSRTGRGAVGDDRRHGAGFANYLAENRTFYHHIRRTGFDPGVYQTHCG
ncbi:MAG: hypothetical protein KatS3mg104_2446 [Phycisphaerae bacterium]|nr:MAG: hypothetical protein KatS3mg104_2446 [Phycisphaerae bacterium]